MTTPADLASDLGRLGQAIEQARTLVAGLDQVEAARQCSDLRYTPLRTVLELAADAIRRVQEHLSSPLVEPCIPPYPPTFLRDGGSV
jgi:hypothetical protein